MKNKDIRLTVLFTFIGALAGALLGWLQVETASEALMGQVRVEVVIAVSALQSAIYAFVSTFFGLKLARKVNLRLQFTWNKNSAILATILGFATALFLLLSDLFIFSGYLPEQPEAYEFSFLYFFSSVLYGGIVEELMLRLFVMSLLVFLLWKLLARSKEDASIPNIVYVSAIILAALLFAVGHLPATAQVFGLTTPIVIRALVLNGFGGLVFGYLYWKHGLAYAMLAHMLTHVFNQLILMPLFL